MIFSLARLTLLPLMLVIFFGNKGFAQFMEVETYDAVREENVLAFKLLSDSM